MHFVDKLAQCVIYCSRCWGSRCHREIPCLVSEHIHQKASVLLSLVNKHIARSAKVQTIRLQDSNNLACCHLLLTRKFLCFTGSTGTTAFIGVQIGYTAGLQECQGASSLLSSISLRSRSAQSAASGQFSQISGTCVNPSSTLDSGSLGWSQSPTSTAVTNTGFTSISGYAISNGPITGLTISDAAGNSASAGGNVPYYGNFPLPFTLTLPSGAKIQGYQAYLSSNGVIGLQFYYSC